MPCAGDRPGRRGGWRARWCAVHPGCSPQHRPGLQSHSQRHAEEAAAVLLAVFSRPPEQGGAGACTLAVRQAEVHILAWPAAGGSPAGARAGWGRPEGSVLVVSLLPGLLATLAVMHASTQRCRGDPVDDAIRPALSCACDTDCQSAPLLRDVLPLAATGHMIAATRLQV